MMELPLISEPLLAIRELFLQERQAGRARHRDIAEKLLISEGELMAAHIGAEPTSLMRVTRLQPRWVEVLTAMAGLGEVMALTRNASCVHEKEGVHAALGQAVASVQGQQIDLICRFEHWQHAFAVEESGEKGVQRSVQFYDAAGMAVHKVFLRQQSDLPAYFALVSRFADADQKPGVAVNPLTTVTGLADFPAFLDAWETVQDARDLHALLAQSRGSCHVYLQQMNAESVQAVSVQSARVLLENAASEAVAMLVLVGNAGATQAHNGPIDKVVGMGPWLNVLDPGFNLHLREDHIASAWVVVQSGFHGMFSALALLNQPGELIALLAAESITDKPEAGAWASLIDRLPRV